MLSAGNFANRLDTDQAWKKCRAWFVPNMLDTLMVLLKEIFFEKLNFWEKKITRDDKKSWKFLSMQRMNTQVL